MSGEPSLEGTRKLTRSKHGNRPERHVDTDDFVANTIKKNIKANGRKVPSVPNDSVRVTRSKATLAARVPKPSVSRCFNF